ncbi:Root phototropism protein [Thalictrum thalictroides]|uniref:Root phototropism protein n=1 Tax=Thalictrum thalictroides TaxID=46969 RepID=A0A7J6VU23_THATH|nr:Root phototropism protein [Thalictrum thalictroides]
MKKLYSPESVATASTSMGQLAVDCWFDDTSILDMDYFIKTLSGIKAKGVRPDLIGSIITSYASKWLPELSDEETKRNITNFQDSPDSITAQWMKKRFFVETLVGILPPEKDSVSCNFLLRLLRTGNMIGIEPTYRIDLEKRISWQLDQAFLKELMIPSFSHTCRTVLDVELVLRLVQIFVNMEEAAKSGAALVKVAKLVDSYLAEAAIDSNLALSDFAALAGSLPNHARTTNDGLYRAIDTYLKVHPGASKQERNYLCSLIDSRKLSSEASLHAAQNERLPVRAVIQVLFSEHAKIKSQFEWSGSLSGSTRSPKPVTEPSVRCISKRETNIHNMELKKLREDVHRLQTQCNYMQAQMDKLTRKKKGFFRWIKLGVSSCLFRPLSVVERIDNSGGVIEAGFQHHAPLSTKGKLVQPKIVKTRRKSM